MLLLSLSLSEVLTHCSGHVLLLILFCCCDHGNGDEEVEAYGGKKKIYCRVEKSHNLKATVTVAVQASSSR